jgi:hypothetical protein
MAVSATTLRTSEDDSKTMLEGRGEFIVEPAASEVLE